MRQTPRRTSELLVFLCLSLVIASSSGRYFVMKMMIKNKLDFRETALVLGVAFLRNEVVYLGARQIAQSWHHYDMTTSIDRLVPFLPWRISVYWGCFLLWGHQLLSVCSTGKARA